MTSMATMRRYPACTSTRSEDVSMLSTWERGCVDKQPVIRHIDDFDRYRERVEIGLTSRYMWIGDQIVRRLSEGTMES